MQSVQRYSLVSAITSKLHQQERSFPQERGAALTFAKSLFSVFQEYHHNCFYSAHLKKEQCTVMFIYVPLCHQQPSPAMNCRR